MSDHLHVFISLYNHFESCNANYGALEVATAIVTSVELRKIQTRRFAIFNENYCQQPLQLKVSERAIQTIYHTRSDFTKMKVKTVWNNTSLRKEILCHKTETDNFK